MSEAACGRGSFFNVFLCSLVRLVNLDMICSVWLVRIGFLYMRAGDFMHETCQLPRGQEPAKVILPFFMSVFHLCNVSAVDGRKDDGRGPGSKFITALTTSTFRGEELRRSFVGIDRSSTLTRSTS